jgi:signal peptidase I
MEPTIHCGRPKPGCLGAADDRVVVRVPARTVRRGDILVFKAPKVAARRCGAGGTFLKRIVGLPGETWSERGGYVYVDGRKLSEPYLRPNRRSPVAHRPARIPANAYVVLGDNRIASCDSAVWGPLPKADIIGKVMRIEHAG